MKRKQYALKKKQLSFIKTWKSIECRQKKVDELTEEEDVFEKSKPTFQEDIAKKKTIKRLIDYSNFTQVSWDQINRQSAFDCFHGILFYIFYNSEGLLNLDELEFHFSGANMLHYLLHPEKNKMADITSLYDFDDLQKEFKTFSLKNAFFGVKFQRIKINPIAYAIRLGESGNQGFNFTSFTFTGLNVATGKWEILHEQCNTNDLIRGNLFMLYFTKNTDQYYTAFKIQQTDTGSHDFWGISIKNFEIHGYVQYLPFENVDLFKEEINTSIENYETANPCFDMNDFLL